VTRSSPDRTIERKVVRIPPAATPTGEVARPTQPSALRDHALVERSVFDVVVGGGQPLGDDTDLQSVYQRYAGPVSRWAARLAGPGFDIEDIVQEVFLVVRRRLAGFRGDARISTWLYEITVRVVQGVRRKRRRQQWWRSLSNFTQEEGGHGTFDVADDRLSPLDALERRQATVQLYRFLDRLDDKYRTAVVLFELEGIPCDEIATITGTSVSNVWARVSRGREKLLQAFANWDADNGLRQGR
jgi:RNA polymerase sigma-70 factor (ECF subfamily)